MIRVFFAIDLPQTVKKQIDTLVSHIQKYVKRQAVHWVKHQQFHITLQFLNAIEEKDVSPLIEIVHEGIKNINSFELCIGPVELFPTPQHPHIISLAVAPHETLSQLSAAIGLGISAMKYPVEPRPFRGHLTLGRMNDKHAQIILPEIELSFTESITVNHIVLFQSEPGTGGSRYTPLSVVSLSQ